MLSTYTDAIGWTLHAVAIVAGVLTVLAALALVGFAIWLWYAWCEVEAEHVIRRIDVRRNRP